MVEGLKCEKIMFLDWAPNILQALCWVKRWKQGSRYSLCSQLLISKEVAES